MGDPARAWPLLHNIMASLLGGKHRWNEMLFHDVHHAFPNAVGTLSQRGRFHGWQKVHDACVEVLHRGIWVENGDAETDMQKTQRNRSILMKSKKKVAENGCVYLASLVHYFTSNQNSPWKLVFA